MDVAVVGAGAAGLGAAAELRRRGVRVVVIERGVDIGASWRARYDGLRLNSARSISGLRGVPIPWSAGRFPSRDAYADYLARCVERLGLDVRLGVDVERIERSGDGYVLRTSHGELTARRVVVACGYDRVPKLPDWPGRDSFSGELLHASAYRSAASYVGRSVLVVGAGNTGTEIAAQLSAEGASRVWVALRTAPNIFPRQILGVPVSVLGAIAAGHPRWLTDVSGRLIQRLAWGDLSRHGMPRAPMGVGTELRRKGLGPVIDGGFVDELRAGRVSLIATIARFEAAEVVLADDTRVRPDVVIAATGYRHALEDLVGHLGVVLPSGRPTRLAGTADPAAPGLYFNGYWQPLPGQLPGMRTTSRRIARAIARELRPAATPQRRKRLCVKEVAVA